MISMTKSINSIVQIFPFQTDYIAKINSPIIMMIGAKTEKKVIFHYSVLKKPYSS